MKKILIFLLAISFALLFLAITRKGNSDETPQSNESLKAGWITKNKVEPLNLELPPGLEKQQISDTYKFRDQYFAIFQKSNLNFPVSSDVQRSGVLVANEGDTNWKILLEIEDQPRNKNNPYYVAIENGLIYILIVDTNGAGSGEGVAKLIESSDQGASWVTRDCFYYAVETFLEAANKSISLLDTVKIYPSINPPFTKRYEFNKNKGYFEQENCQNLKILTPQSDNTSEPTL
ncbi:hypothetical protein A2715_04560 [Candidatus Woesebacteria bacterium RIFCSPHIGHO2_01_FULL_39_32]|uniref:Uncharacterized protein n=1 Tax=Candidatus Woesebacteria bacterium RIFCSPLOWO2_01_FULL_39_25 TaxID=1802521 RepID=A0A1F8BLI1_9BACT|nr:MAG: hypothetical protein A2124_02615 [Candidatus Woesebacteria bacterium GWB1_37_5]OGM25289.1 MAG: hypothetical protein A2715_04560 [Candidatus Woesebacteria bacterium RIFCSPHIGHO2_01_FULL_39_32]OGM37788.1 MAG: hypothetical protein A3F01_01770 [Candidatus Woesebacteria bacterium RIFCSPHIGHO2_12_FULL_38_11]OGM64820.1 MAG: hypothetical protein A2893_04170 [Candidatus Woesebacteria bacterium RIFCSPLOWO2_01_FULL_39_25]